MPFSNPGRECESLPRSAGGRPSVFLRHTSITWTAHPDTAEKAAGRGVDMSRGIVSSSQGPSFQNDLHSRFAILKGGRSIGIGWISRGHVKIGNGVITPKKGEDGRFKMWVGLPETLSAPKIPNSSPVIDLVKSSQEMFAATKTAGAPVKSTHSSRAGFLPSIRQPCPRGKASIGAIDGRKGKRYPRSAGSLRRK